MHALLWCMGAVYLHIHQGPLVLGGCVRVQKDARGTQRRHLISTLKGPEW